MGDPQYDYPNTNPNQGYSNNRLYNEPYGQPNYYGQPQPPLNHGHSNQPNLQGGQYCPVCNMNTNSYVKRAPGNITWIWCIILLFFTGFLCWVPFFCDSCK